MALAVRQSTGFSFIQLMIGLLLSTLVGAALFSYVRSQQLATRELLRKETVRQSLERSQMLVLNEVETSAFIHPRCNNPKRDSRQRVCRLR